VPQASAEFATKVVRTVRTLRGLGLRKPPSISETIDWARTLLALGIEDVDGTALTDTLGVLLKNRADQDRAVDALALRGD
jgi:MoxR-like ATPase